MKTLFDPSLYQFDTPQPSYWEASAGDVELQCKPLAGAHNCDIAIIGGGYTGLSAALHLARDFDIDVAVLVLILGDITSTPVWVFTDCGAFSISRSLSDLG